MWSLISRHAEAIRPWLPPIVGVLYHRHRMRKFGFHGNFRNWESAARFSGGYHSDAILNASVGAARLVAAGKAAFERDAVAFKAPSLEWPLIAALMCAAGPIGEDFKVLDFGGGLGSLYFQHRRILDQFERLRWCVVEQPRMAAAGVNEFGNERLRFFSALDRCLQEGPFNILVLSSVLPYVQSPYALLSRLLDLKIPYAFIHKTPLLPEGCPDRLTVQHVSPSIYPASYPAWFFSRENFMTAIQKSHRVLVSYPCPVICNLRSDFEGFILEKI